MRQVEAPKGIPRLRAHAAARALLAGAAAGFLMASPTLATDRSWAILGALAFAAALGAVLARRSSASVAAVLWGGIAVDLAALAALVGETGGAESPLVFLYPLPVLAAGLLVSAPAGTLALVAATALIRAEGLGTEQAGRLPQGLESLATLWLAGGTGLLFGSIQESRLKRAAVEADLAHAITEDVARGESLDRILENLSVHLVASLRLRGAAVLMRVGKRLRCRAAAGIGGAVGRDLAVRGALALASSTGRPIVVAPREVRRDRTLTEIFGVCRIVVVPMGTDGLLVGVPRARGWSLTSQMRLLARLADHARLAFATTRLSAHVESLAITDPLTGLANHRQLQRRLGEEVGRLERYAPLRARGHRVSFALIDVDLFRAFNDAHGHHAGDEILKGMADAIRGAVRGFDIVARFGGEEFAVVLPETDAPGARRVAERIRAAVASHPFPPPRVGDASPVLTVSIGVATAPESGSTPAELIAAADRALVASKDAGRNLVTHVADAPRKTAAVVAFEKPKRPRQGRAGRPARGESQRARGPSSHPTRRTPRG